MQYLRVNITDCSYARLVRIAKKCGFVIKEGGKHCKIKTEEDIFITTIPRHNRLKRETVLGIIKSLNKFGANITYS